MTNQPSFSKGLADVVADTSAVSDVQGDRGRLVYRGYSIEDLAAYSTFEETAYLLLKGKLPNSSELKKFSDDLKAARKLPAYAEAIIDSSPKSAHPMTVLQTVMSSLAYDESVVKLSDVEKNIATSVKTVSQLATAVARISRHRKGLPLVQPDMSLNHAQNFLFMMNGKRYPEVEEHMFEVALILHMDHSFNASTFAGRVVGSTEARILSSISGAVGALSGPLHGGANEKVLEMADGIGSADKAKEWVLDAITKKKKVMGFGHRVYRTMDPRAKVLRKMLEDLVTAKKDDKTYSILLNVHDTMIAELSKKEKDYIWPNVDFWSGGLYRLMNIESIDYTPIFAVARVVGWCAHIVEMWQDNRIYRPAAIYTGEAEVNYKKIGDR